MKWIHDTFSFSINCCDGKAGWRLPGLRAGWMCIRLPFDGRETVTVLIGVFSRQLIVAIKALRAQREIDCVLTCRSPQCVDGLHSTSPEGKHYELQNVDKINFDKRTQKDVRGR